MSESGVVERACALAKYTFAQPWETELKRSKLRVQILVLGTFLTPSLITRFIPPSPEKTPYNRTDEIGKKIERKN